MTNMCNGSLLFKLTSNYLSNPISNVAEISSVHDQLLFNQINQSTVTKSNSVGRQMGKTVSQNSSRNCKSILKTKCKRRYSQTKHKIKSPKSVNQEICQHFSTLDTNSSVSSGDIFNKKFNKNINFHPYVTVISIPSYNEETKRKLWLGWDELLKIRNEFRKEKHIEVSEWLSHRTKFGLFKFNFSTLHSICLSFVSSALILIGLKNHSDIIR